MWRRATTRAAGAWLGAALLLLPSDLPGQGITTAAIRGTVRGADGAGADGAVVTVVHQASGVQAHAEVRHGRFLVQGLEVGGPYTIRVRRIGFHPHQRDALFLSLGSPLDLQFVLQPAALPLDTLAVTTWPMSRANAHGGTATTVPDSLLHRLPSLNRNLYDFVRLAPQVSTRIGFAPGGLSGAGAGFRSNSFLINGVPQQSIGGQVPPEFAGGRSVPLEAVREYQILVAPFDVRYGDFAGALVNAVTRAGTNQFQGSVFGSGRNDALARQEGAAGAIPYQRLQYGLALGGPIWRDRVHFFLAPEFQYLTSPAPGPYLGQPASAPEPVPVAAAELARLATVMGSHGLVSGSGGAVENSNPIRSLFGRLDVALPGWNSRLVGWVTDSRVRSLTFTRASRDLFPLSSHRAPQANRVRNLALQFHTALGRGGQNELLASYRSARAEWDLDIRQPLISVAVPGTGAAAVAVVTGTPTQAQGQFNGYHALNLRDHLTVPLGAAHVVTLGAEAEWFHLGRGGVPNGYGSWTFASVDSLALGLADRYEVARDFGSAGVPLDGAHYAILAGDQWRAGGRVTLTMGLRAEALLAHGQARYNPEVEAIFGRRTDGRPRQRVYLSPRLGFTWDLAGTGRDQLRGGLGVFTGRPPAAWVHASRSSHGTGIGTLRCGRLPTDLGPPPAFEPDYRSPPGACGNGVGFATAARGDVDLIDPGTGMAQALRGVLAWDRRLPGGWIATVEALVSRHLSDFVFVNLNLVGPQGVDRNGRVLYGTIGPTGLAAPALRSGFSEVIDLRTTSRNSSTQLSVRLVKPFAAGTAVTAHYTHSRVRDVQTPLRINVPGTVNWASRAEAGRHDLLRPGISLNDIPHRLVVAGTWRAPWRRWTTELAVQYVGESGTPFTYLTWGAVRGRGDLNADGSNLNDPVYVPRSAHDTGEIRFAEFTRQVPGPGGSTSTETVSVARQADALEALIRDTPCLRRQRGRILERNSCRDPWSHTTIASLRQAIPMAGRALEAQLDVFNLLNLLHAGWGRLRTAAPALLEHVDQVAMPGEASQPVFRFNPSAPRWTTVATESSFQLQVALRYRF